MAGEACGDFFRVRGTAQQLQRAIRAAHEVKQPLVTDLKRYRRSGGLAFTAGEHAAALEKGDLRGEAAFHGLQHGEMHAGENTAALRMPKGLDGVHACAADAMGCAHLRFLGGWRE